MLMQFLFLFEGISLRIRHFSCGVDFEYNSFRMIPLLFSLGEEIC